MKPRQLLRIASLAVPILAIVPQARLMNNEQELDRHSTQSLPNLLKVDEVSHLYANWDIRDSMELDVGRLLVNHGRGSIWSRRPLGNSKDEWTVDLMFRNSEQVDVDDHSFYDSNGLSFWLLDGHIPEDTLNFGGPQRYDGLQFLMNNLDYKGLKIFANDGSRNVVNSEAGALGGCRVNYLDSMVPFSMRISYSASRKWFKVQIDNSLCFSTNAVTFRGLGSDLRFGVSASTNPISREYWEVLKMNVYDHLTEDAIDDHGIAGGVPQIKRVTQPQNQESQETAQPLQKYPTFMERKMASLNDQSQHVQDTAKFGASFSEITHKLALLEKTVGAFDVTKMVDLSVAIDGIRQTQSLQLEVLGELKHKYENLEVLLASQYKEMIESMRVLNQEVIDEIRRHYSEVRSVSQKVDLLMNNHKEIQGQYKNLDSKSANSDLLSTIVKWVLIPLIVGIVAVIVVVHRLKKDIKHYKLL